MCPVSACQGLYSAEGVEAPGAAKLLAAVFDRDARGTTTEMARFNEQMAQLTFALSNSHTLILGKIVVPTRFYLCRLLLFTSRLEPMCVSYRATSHRGRGILYQL